MPVSSHNEIGQVSSGITFVSNDTFNTLYNDHQSWLCGWLSKKIGCSAQAADLTQDAFIRLLQIRQKEGSFPELKEPRAYLTKVAGRLVYDYFGRLSLEQSYLDTLALVCATEMPSPQENLIFQEALQTLDYLLNSMNPPVRAAFLLSQLEGLTYAEIAVKLNISQRTVKRYMAQAFEECIMLIDYS